MIYIIWMTNIELLKFQIVGLTNPDLNPNPTKNEDVIEVQLCNAL